MLLITLSPISIYSSIIHPAVRWFLSVRHIDSLLYIMTLLDSSVVAVLYWLYAVSMMSSHSLHTCLCSKYFENLHSSWDNTIWSLFLLCIVFDILVRTSSSLSSSATKTTSTATQLNKHKMIIIILTMYGIQWIIKLDILVRSEGRDR